MVPPIWYNTRMITIIITVTTLFTVVISNSKKHSMTVITIYSNYYLKKTKHTQLNMNFEILENFEF